MKCFFGHSFGRVEADGFQYCKSCGIAQQPEIPSPCKNGHAWRDTGEPDYKIVTNYGQWTEYYVAQKCSRCGDRRSVCKY